LIAPEMAPHTALGNALEAVYGVTGGDRAELAEWFRRGEEAYFARSNFKLGSGPLSLEPLIWKENPSVSGPPIYLQDRMTPADRAGYASELRTLQAELRGLAIPNEQAKQKTSAAIDGALHEITQLNGSQSL
jgi:hypothetical protein